MIGKKIVCMRKIGEIVCPRGASEKIVCRNYPCYARFGKLKKIVCTVRQWRRKICKCSIDGGKFFFAS